MNKSGRQWGVKKCRLAQCLMQANASILEAASLLLFSQMKKKKEAILAGKITCSLQVLHFLGYHSYLIVPILCHHPTTTITTSYLLWYTTNQKSPVTMWLLHYMNHVINPNPNSLFIVEVHLALRLVHRHSTFWNKLNRLRIPTGRRQTSWLYTSAAEELNQGLPGTNPGSGQSGTWTRDLPISSPPPWPLGHAASL